MITSTDFNTFFNIEKRATFDLKTEQKLKKVGLKRNVHMRDSQCTKKMKFPNYNQLEEHNVSFIKMSTVLIHMDFHCRNYYQFLSMRIMEYGLFKL